MSRQFLRSFALDEAGESGMVLAAFAPSAIALAWFVSRASAFWVRQPSLRVGWLVVGLFLYLAWEAWPRRPSLRLRGSWLGLGLAGMGILGVTEAQVYRMAFGETTVSLFLLGCGLLSMMAANVDFVYGRRGLGCFGFAIGFLLLALPMPATLAYPVVSGLQRGVAEATVRLLCLGGIPAHRSGNAIGLLHGVVGIDEACSGIRSLQATVMATLFIGYLALRRKLLRVVLVMLGVGLALTGNLIRSLCLGVVAGRNGTAAVEAYHDPAGWSVLAVTVAGVVLCSWMLHKLETITAESGEGPEPRRTRTTSAGV